MLLHSMLRTVAPPPILDAHVHQWDPRNTPRPVTAAVKLLGWNRGLLKRVALLATPGPLAAFVGKPDHVLREYLLGDLRRDWAERAPRVEGVVHVQAGWQARRHASLVDETRWLEGLDPRGDVIHAIVGAARLEARDLPEVLDAHASASDRFRGVRDMLAAHPDDAIADFARHPDLLSNEAWRSGYALLGERGLTYDAWMYHHQIDAFAELAEAHPDTPFVLCHLGTPVALGGPFGGRGGTAWERAGIEEQWKAALTRLAALPHGHFKISGLLMPIVGFGLEARDAPMSQSEFVDRVGPHVAWALDTLGIERCLFGSNFPMDKVSIEWATLVSAYEELLAARSDTERRAFFSGTARSVYRIGDPTPG